MNNCDKCNNSCKNPCSESYSPAKYGCDFDISVNPFDDSIWNITICGATTKMKVPKLSETDTKLSTSFSNKSLIYNAEKHTDIINGDQLGGIINLSELRDIEAPNADSCDLLVFDPGCSACGDGCKPRNPMWRNYHIPDAGDCEMEPDEDGYYKILKKNDCGCIEECRLPIAPSGMTTVDYIRDSVPDDPDFPWYYGCYNDRINLYLEQNASRFFGKYDLKITVNYGIQCVKPTVAPGVNFRSLVVPVITGEPIDVTKEASILQANSSYSASDPQIPWGSQSLRGSFTFIVPKGKDAYLHHEFRLRTNASFPNYATHPLDRQRVPDDVAGQVDRMSYVASRLNALQIIIEPTFGISNSSPVTDPYRDLLDPGTKDDDAYPPII